MEGGGVGGLDVGGMGEMEIFGWEMEKEFVVGSGVGSG